MSVNKVILLGYVGQDPAVFRQGNGDPIVNFSMATTDRWKDKHGEQQEKTEWHKLVFFGRLAQVAEQYVKKGARLYVEGKLQTRKYQDKSGRDVFTTEIVGNVMHMLESKNPHQDRTIAAPIQNPQPVNNGEFEDDIPF